MDEISMVSADQFLQCDVRFRQAKMQTESRFGRLAMNFCGDFLQLPPVDKDGSRKSLALPADEIEHTVADGSEDDDLPKLEKGKRQEYETARFIHQRRERLAMRSQPVPARCRLRRLFNAAVLRD